MIRITRLVVSLALIALLAGCGNKGDLVKPTAPTESAPAPPAQG